MHEWIGLAEPGKSARQWLPPLSILTDLARNATKAEVGRTHLVWIGQSVWPYPVVLAQARLLEKCLFVRTTGPPESLWAADLALRCRGVAAVIADGSRFDLSATRRLQLAAEAGGGVCLLARPSRERTELSAATTRWAVSRCASPTGAMRCTLELLRCKGVMSAAHSVWTLERDHATRCFRVAPDVLDRPGQEEAARRIG